MSSCIPHSEPQIIEGHWVTDFEWNEFFQGRQPTPKEALQEEAWTRLEFARGVEPPESKEGQARLWSLTFVGRRETCEILPNFPPSILVEKILERSLVWEVEGYPTYEFD